MVRFLPASKTLCAACVRSQTVGHEGDDERGGDGEYEEIDGAGAVVDGALCALAWYLFLCARHAGFMCGFSPCHVIVCNAPMADYVIQVRVCHTY